MNKAWGPTEEQFNKLLDWLDLDREAAAQKYAQIQLRLVRFFAARGCVDAENLADRCLDIVAGKHLEDLGAREGDRASYFLAVARYVHLEDVREHRRPQPPPLLPLDPEPNLDLDTCLDQCLEQLPPDERSLVLDYEQGEKQARIQNRRRIAQDLGITLNALRIKIYRLHQHLEKCIGSGCIDGLLPLAARLSDLRKSSFCCRSGVIRKCRLKLSSSGPNSPLIEASINSSSVASNSSNSSSSAKSRSSN